MRKLAFLAPLAGVLAVAAAAHAEPATVNVTIGPELRHDAIDLGEREVRDQADRLAQVVSRELESRGVLEGAQVNLVLLDIAPNRPTFQQMADRPGLDGHRSVSAGGAEIGGEIITADGERIPVRYRWYTASVAEVTGFTTWQDADRAFNRLADNLAEGRYSLR